MEPRGEEARRRHTSGYDCAQAVACTYADLVGVDEETIFAATEALGLGLGCMEGTCGSLSGACVLVGLKNSTVNLDKPNSKGSSYRIARQMVERFEELSGATRCRDLKGVDTGVVLCTCPQCVQNGCKVVEEFLFPDEA